MTAMGQKETFGSALGMSALPLKADNQFRQRIMALQHCT
jgi:hypothetical protein